MVERSLSPAVLLRRAIRSGDLQRVRELLDAGVDPNDHVRTLSLVALAAGDGQQEIAELLIERGADPTWSTPDGWTAATVADAAEQYDQAERLVALGAPEPSRTAHGYTQLHRAARRGDLEAVGALCSPNAVDPVDAQGDTPVALAIQFRQEVVARALVEAGADPNHVNKNWALLAEAAYQDSVLDRSTRFVDLLLDAGADPNPRGYPPLFNTVNQEGSSAEVMRRLVNAGADIRVVFPTDGETILHRIAWIESDPDIVDAAIELGASPEARDGQGRTPLLAAACGPNFDTFTQLVKRGADQTARDAQGRGAEDLLDDSPQSDQIREVLAQPG